MYSFDTAWPPFCGATLSFRDLVPRHLLRGQVPDLYSSALPSSSSQIKPHMCLNVVLWDPFSRGVEEAKAELRNNLPLFCRQSIPDRSLPLVARNSLTVAEHVAEVELCL